MIYKPHDVVLVPFPFTDLNGQKQRPAVIICTDTYLNRRPDTIILAITSQLKSEGYVVADWKAAGLLKPSVLKPVITTIEQTQIIKKLGALEGEDKEQLHRLLSETLVLA